MRSYSIMAVMLLGMTVIASARAEERTGHFFIEPEVGYGFAGSLGVSGSPSDAYSGIDLGARLGIHLGKVLFLGGSFKYLPSVSYVPDGSTTAMSPNPTLMEGGALLGLMFNRFRVWGGYNFLESLGNFQQSGATLTLSGSAFFAGAGLRFLGPLSVNVEGVLQTFTSMTGTASGVTISGPLTSNLTGKVVIGTLSLPINF